MMNFIDTFLDKITMYRLVFYELIFLLGVAAVLGFFGLMPYSPIAIGLSALFLVAICWITNAVFARVWNVPANMDSAYITALILALLITPIRSIHDVAFFGWAAVLSMASKYIVTLQKKHIFNPVALSLVLIAFWLGQSASWWVGTSAMAPFILLVGFLTVRKIERWDMVISFFISAIATISVFVFFGGGDIWLAIRNTFLQSSLLFFGFIMLTEPFTTPPTKKLRIWYGMLVGFLFAPQVHLGSLFSTPELALVVGNVFTYIVGPKQKLIATLQEKIQIGEDSIDFIFAPAKKFHFIPGQYMEWTVGHQRPDSRGTRRYLTIASSPTEATIRLGVKFYPNGSSYKKAMAAYQPNQQIIADQLRGDFTLPEDTNKKLVFLAGGIGITPFRSMLKYLIDTGEKRSIVMLYSNKRASEIMYKDVFDNAESTLGIRTIYTLTDTTQIDANWKGRAGRVDAAMIEQEIPDYGQRTFYLSGPHAMVAGFEATLKSMGIPVGQIKKDFFPGYV